MQTVPRCVTGGMVALFALANLAFAGQTDWSYDPNQAGDWHEPTNWSAGVPDSVTDAYIDNGGTVELASGTAAGFWIVVGDDSPGAIVQTGGTVEADEIRIANRETPGGISSYQLIDGTVDSRELVIGQNGECTFVQQAGSIQVSEDFYVGFQSNADALYEMQGGSVSTGWLLVGSQGKGVVRLREGTITVSSDINLGLASGGVGGTLNLQGGSLSARNANVGYFGPGDVIQTGGSLLLSGDLTLGRSTAGQGTYEISSGQLHVDSLAVGSSSQGEFAISGPAADVRVRGAFVLAPSGQFSASRDSRIHLDGADVRIQMTNAATATGLWNTTMVFDPQGETSYVEAAGQDLGTNGTGYVNNFAMAGMEVGPTGTVALRDAQDNIAGAAEAVYVEKLVLAAGSTLDLAGIDLFYLTLVDEGGTVITGGGAFARGALVGDADFDGAVDYEDAELLMASYHAGGVGYRWQDGDFDGDGDVDFDDAWAMIDNYQQLPGAPSASQVMSMVPEPTTVVVMTVMAGGLLRRRKLRRSRS